MSTVAAVAVSATLPYKIKMPYRVIDLLTETQTPQKDKKIMSTVLAPLQPTPGLSHFLQLFNSLAVQSAAGLATVTTDLSEGEKTQAVSDSVTAVGTGLAALNPAWAPDIAAASITAQLGIAIISGFISLFHHPKKQSLATSSSNSSVVSG